MDRDQAAATLDEVTRAEHRLAQHAHWPFHRHAMFGLMEGLLVAGAAQPLQLLGPMIAASGALLTLCVTEDRRRHGMFVSGWQPGATRPLMVLVTIFVAIMLVASVLVRNSEAASPIGYALGAITFAVCTLASLRWETLYRRNLRGDQR